MLAKNTGGDDIGHREGNQADRNLGEFSCEGQRGECERNRAKIRKRQVMSESQRSEVMFKEKRAIVSSEDKT